MKPVFPLCGNVKQQSVQTLQGACVDFAVKLKQGFQAGDLDVLQLNLGLYGSRGDASVVVAREAQAHVGNDNTCQYLYLKVWEGKLVEALEEACKNGTLTETHVALSPAAGTDVWEQVVHAYAKQLAGIGEHHAAVAYLVGCHRVKQGIEIYVSAHMYSEALALSKLRLAKEDPLIPIIIQSWATFSLASGHYEQAAKCYLALGQPLTAVHSLMQRAGLHSLKCAAAVASATGVMCVGLNEKLILEYRVLHRWNHAWVTLCQSLHVSPLPAVSSAVDTGLSVDRALQYCLLIEYVLQYALSRSVLDNEPPLENMDNLADILANLIKQAHSAMPIMEPSIIDGLVPTNPDGFRNLGPDFNSLPRVCPPCVFPFMDTVREYLRARGLSVDPLELNFVYIEIMSPAKNFLDIYRYSDLYDCMILSLVKISLLFCAGDFFGALTITLKLAQVHDPCKPESTPIPLYLTVLSSSYPTTLVPGIFHLVTSRFFQSQG